jgi:hypothetical protein
MKAKRRRGQASFCAVKQPRPTQRPRPHDVERVRSRASRPGTPLLASSAWQPLEPAVPNPSRPATGPTRSSA